jgi:hypothetical protein
MLGKSSSFSRDVVLLLCKITVTFRTHTVQVLGSKELHGRWVIHIVQLNDFTSADAAECPA